MAEDFPLMPVPSGGAPSPIETSTASSAHPQDEGGLVASFWTSYRNSPVVTGMMRGYGDLRYGAQTVPHDKAVEAVKAQGLDPAFVPEDGIGYGALQEEIQRQAGQKIEELRLNRSGGPSGFDTVAGGLGAGFADPSNLVLGPVAARIATLARGALAARAAAGAGIAAAYQGGMEAGQAHMTGHDEDIGSWTMLRDLTFAGATGGLMGAAFGPRANAGERNLAANNPGNLKVPGSDTFQSFSSMDEGVAAVGRQLDLYRQRGIDTLEKIISAYAPAKNHNDVAAYVADVAKRTGIDPKAKLTDAQMNSVRDAMIIHEQGAGWREKAAAFGRGAGQTEPLDPHQRMAVGQLALRQFEADNPVDVNPFSQAIREANAPSYFRTNPLRIADEHAQEMSDIQGQAYRNVAAEGPTGALRAGLAADMNAAQPDARRLDAPPAVEQFRRATDERAQRAETPAQPASGQTQTDFARRVTAIRQTLPPESHDAFDTDIRNEQSKPIVGTALSESDFGKAVQAALSCATRKGLALGTG